MGKRCISLVKRHGTIGEMIDECVAYEEIGTVEECRAAVDKRKQKKPIIGADFMVGSHFQSHTARRKERTNGK